MYDIGHWLEKSIVYLYLLDLGTRNRSKWINSLLISTFGRQNKSWHEYFFPSIISWLVIKDECDKVATDIPPPFPHTSKFTHFCTITLFFHSSQTDILCPPHGAEYSEMGRKPCHISAAPPCDINDNNCGFTQD